MTAGDAAHASRSPPGPIDYLSHEVTRGSHSCCLQHSERIDGLVPGETPSLRGLTPVTEEVGGNPSVRTLEATDTVVRFPSGTVCQRRIPVLRGLKPVTENTLEATDTGNVMYNVMYCFISHRQERSVITKT